MAFPEKRKDIEFLLWDDMLELEKVRPKAENFWIIRISKPQIPSQKCDFRSTTQLRNGEIFRLRRAIWRNSVLNVYNVTIVLVKSMHKTRNHASPRISTGCHHTIIAWEKNIRFGYDEWTIVGIYPQLTRSTAQCRQILGCHDESVDIAKSIFLLNAIDAVKSVDHPLISIELKPDDRLPGLWLNICDNGIGMDRATLLGMFKPNRTTKLGLGISLRGHKGVGATYLAYGFNHIRVHTKKETFHGVEWHPQIRFERLSTGL